MVSNMVLALAMLPAASAYVTPMASSSSALGATKADMADLAAANPDASGAASVENTFSQESYHC